MNGIYEYKTPDLLFSCDEIRAVVKPGEKFSAVYNKIKEQKGSGDFCILRMHAWHVSREEFSGIEPELSFDVDFTGMKAGDVLEGSLTVCTNMGEKSTSFSFAIMQKKVQLPAGEALRWILLHSWQRSITRKRMRCSAPGVLQGRSKSSIRSLGALNRGLRKQDHEHGTYGGVSDQHREKVP